MTREHNSRHAARLALLNLSPEKVTTRQRLVMRQLRWYMCVLQCGMKLRTRCYRCSNLLWGLYNTNLIRWWIAFPTSPCVPVNVNAFILVTLEHEQSSSLYHKHLCGTLSVADTYLSGWMRTKLPRKTRTRYWINTEEAKLIQIIMNLKFISCLMTLWS